MTDQDKFPLEQPDEYQPLPEDEDMSIDELLESSRRQLEQSAADEDAWQDGSVYPEEGDTAEEPDYPDELDDLRDDGYPDEEDGGFPEDNAYLEEEGTPEEVNEPEASLSAEPHFRDQEYMDTFDEDFERAFEDEPEPRPARQVPPRKKARKFFIPTVLKTGIYLALILVISIWFAQFVWKCADDVLALTSDDAEHTVTLVQGDTNATIAQKLKDAGLIEYPWLFEVYGRFANVEQKVSTGTFTLNSMYDYHALVNGMYYSSADRATVDVTIPEGFECRQIFALLESQGVCKAEDLRAAAASGSFDYWFLENDAVTGDNRLEGYLFPDTYQFYTDDDPQAVLKKMLNNFKKRYTDEMLAAVDTVNGRLSEMMAANGYEQAYIDAHQLTVNDIIIVASLVERETANVQESPKIASVIFNRLTDPDYPYLNIDATIQYALDQRKEQLSYEDLQIDSPYNTYTNLGLPVGPIANPGLDSIRATLQFTDTDYHYYALDTDGTHHFSNTYEEHTAFLESQKNG